MKLKNTNLIVGSICLIVGGAFMYLIENFTLTPKHSHGEQIAIAKPIDPLFEHFFKDDLLEQSADPFKEMQRMRENILKQVNQEPGSGLFGNWKQLKFDSGKSAEISQREDEHYLYYDISVEGVKPEKVKVKVENGQLSISGEVEKKSNEGGSSSYLISSFHRSFPVPHHVDANKVRIDQEKEKLVVKFPKSGKATV